MENEKSKNNGLILLVIVLFVLVLGLGGYIVYDKVLSNKSDETDKTNNTINNDSTNAELFPIENGYSEISLTNEEKEKINNELYNHLQPGNGNDPLFSSKYELNKNQFLDDCKKLEFAKWYITFNNTAGYTYEKVLDKDELGNEFNKVKYSRLEEITKEMFNVKTLTCNANKDDYSIGSKYGVIADENGYVWLSHAGGGFVPIAIRVLSKYKNGNTYYLLIHTYLLNEDNRDLTKENWKYDYEDNPNATSDSHYIKLKYGILGDKKYLIDFEYLK